MDEQRSRRLADDELADEIELYGDLVVAASEADRELSLTEIDKLLGVRPPCPRDHAVPRDHANPG